MQKNRPIGTLEDAKYDLIHNSEMPAKAQAEILGVSYSRYVNSCLPCAETANHLTDWIIPSTMAARNFVLVDYIERVLGRWPSSFLRLMRLWTLRATGPG